MGSRSGGGGRSGRNSGGGGLSAQQQSENRQRVLGGLRNDVLGRIGDLERIEADGGNVRAGLRRARRELRDLDRPLAQG